MDFLKMRWVFLIHVPSAGKWGAGLCPAKQRPCNTGALLAPTKSREKRVKQCIHDIMWLTDKLEFINSWGIIWRVSCFTRMIFAR